MYYRFLGKYAWFIPLKDKKKALQLLILFQKILYKVVNQTNYG